MKHIVNIALLLCASQGIRAQQKEIPVVIIMADQLRYDAIGPYTPHINALKKDGVSFNRTYTATAYAGRAWRSRGRTVLWNFFAARYNRWLPA